jgi:GT2 family glycosyltransferase
MSIAVVILNYNGQAFLAKFLPKVLETSTEADIIVADNGSTDDSVEWMRQQYPQVQLLCSPKNEGYAGGYNTALKQVNAEYYVLMNSDIEPRPNWLKGLMDFMEANPRVAAAQPFILSFAEPTKFEYAGAAGGYWDKYGYPFCRGRIFDTAEENKGQYATSLVNWATGACFLVRAKAYWEVGGLDAYFFAHMEEIDLCWRLQRADYQIAAVAESEVLHVGGGTLPQGNPRKTYLNFRNNLVLIAKNWNPNTKWRTLFMRMLLDGVAGIQFLIKGDWKQLLAILKAHRDFYGYLLTGPRNSNLSADQQKKWIASYSSSIVWDYFIKGRKTFGKLKF